VAKVKLLKVSSFYPEYLTKLYSEDKTLQFQSYQLQYDKMMQQGIGWADYWKINLEKTGLFEVELIIVNNEYSQKKWAEENQFKYDATKWTESIFIEQVRRFEPEILFANDYVFVNAGMIAKLKSTVHSIRKVIGWDGIGMCDRNKYNGYDSLLTCNPYIAKYYNENGLRSGYIQFAFESSLLQKLKLNRSLYDISFVGSLTLRNNGHHNRLKVLGAAAKHFKVDYWLASFDENRPYLLKNIFRKIRSGKWSDATDIIRLWNANKGQLFGMEMYQALADSRITLNSHIDTALNFGGNIRLWEATGVGTCLVTDWKDNLSEIFKPDEEVVVYRSPAECVEKLHYLIQNPEKAKAIAVAGQKRTLSEYTYEKRMKEIIPFLLD
jgi:spore maturation protein CgeB